ncbi:MAG: ArsR family transcriptional regulator [Caldilineaceae bacterium]|nr:ArsR family transcriptional regulator [Caldilineaceae bacterium]
MHAVRKHILEILKETGGASVADLAERLEMAPVSVRHHLDILQGDNLICVARVERTGNVGRPQQIYQLTEEAMDLFPNNYALLAAGVVRQLKQLLPPEQVRAVFHAMAHEIAEEAGPERLHGLPLEERLEEITAFLNEHGYLARWEVNEGEAGGGYLLHKHNCPYAGVSGEHAELCVMDQMLVDELLGEPCFRTASVVENGHCCTYQVGGRIREPAPQQIVLTVGALQVESG